MWYSTPTTLKIFKNDIDPYGDSYTSATNEEQLREIFEVPFYLTPRLLSLLTFFCVIDSKQTMIEYAELILCVVNGLHCNGESA